VCTRLSKIGCAGSGRSLGLLRPSVIRGNRRHSPRMSCQLRPLRLETGACEHTAASCLPNAEISYLPGARGTFSLGMKCVNFFQCQAVSQCVLRQILRSIPCLLSAGRQDPVQNKTPRLTGSLPHCLTAAAVPLSLRTLESLPSLHSTLRSQPRLLRARAEQHSHPRATLRCPGR
jgi:hypothetical protein